MNKRAKNETKKVGPNVLIRGNRCSRCPHTWVSRKEGEIPTVCPKCKTPYWKTPRRKRKGSAKK